MPLKIRYKKKTHGVKLESGYFYKFNYTAWENDKEPHVIFLNSVSGYHPKTNREHRYFTAINLNYIPRNSRKSFVEDWMEQMENSNYSAKFTWDTVKNKYPYLKGAVRRYFYSPRYYIRKLKHIPFDQVEKEIVRSWPKDFSAKVKRNILSKFKKGKKKGGGLFS